MGPVSSARHRTPARGVLAWNRASEAVNGWSRLPDDRRNLVWFVFMVPSTRRLLVEWEKEAPLTVAALRAEAGRELSAPDYQALIADLLAGSPDFATIWARQDVRGRREGLKRFQHPTLGRFDLEFTSFQVAEQPTLRLSLHACRRRPQRDDAARDRRPATGSIVTGLTPAPAASATTASALVRCPSQPHAASAQRPDAASAPRCPRRWHRHRSTCVPCASAGYRVGYHDAAHFNREYKSLFGVLPLRDVQRLRQVASAVPSR